MLGRLLGGPSVGFVAGFSVGSRVGLVGCRALEKSAAKRYGLKPDAGKLCGRAAKACCRLRAASATTAFVVLLLPRSSWPFGPPSSAWEQKQKGRFLRRLTQAVGSPELFGYSSKQ